VTRLADYALRHDSMGRSANQFRWYAAAMRGDTAMLQRLASDDDTPAGALQSYTYHSIRSGLGLQQADEASAAMPAASVLSQFYYALNRGSLSRARAITDRGRADPNRAAARVVPLYVVQAAMYGLGDSTAAAAATADVAQLLDPNAADIPTNQREPARCTLAQWDLKYARYDKAAAAMPLLRAAKNPDGRPYEYGRVCAEFIEARIAVAQKQPNARAALARIDSSLATMPAGLSRNTLNQMTIGLAGAYEDLGDAASALRVVRRRSFYHGDYAEYLSTSKLMEARLAAAAGERDAAIRAYQHYLALMSDAESAFAENVAYARRELQRLTAER
jgi:hypothetical protein